MDIKKCPLDGKKLVEIILKQEKVDICPHCNGIFFDQGELENISRLVEIFREVNIQEQDIAISGISERGEEICCPLCKTSMQKREIGGQVVDLCPRCNGIWLDGGEIAALRLAERHIKDNLSLYIRLGQ